jgi:hypothetical protein
MISLALRAREINIFSWINGCLIHLVYNIYYIHIIFFRIEQHPDYTVKG